MLHTVRNILANLFLLAMAATALALPPNDWTWQNPLPQGNDLEAVWGRAANDVYAIGGQQTLMHWNGADWSVAARPTSMPITDMWGLDSGVLFAVGWYGAVLRFDGGRRLLLDDQIAGSPALSGDDRNTWQAVLRAGGHAA